MIQSYMYIHNMIYSLSLVPHRCSGVKIVLIHVYICNYIHTHKHRHIFLPDAPQVIRQPKWTEIFVCVYGHVYVMVRACVYRIVTF